MQEVIIIGTLHSESTPHDELQQTLMSLKPDKVLVELSPEELSEKFRETSIRDEMIKVYDWATENDIPVDVFDVENDILKEGVTGDEPIFKEHAQKSKEILKNYTWKELNNEEPWNNDEILKMDEKLKEKYIDREKSRKREEQILEGIKEKLIDGKNVVVTGVSHLTFLKEHLPHAQLPLRNN